MRTRAFICCLVVLTLGLTACGDDDGGAAAESTTSSTTAPSTTEGDEETTTTTTEASEDTCPDDAPIPAEATEVTTATLDYDGDGDGTPDTLSTFFHEDMWWLQAEWSAGGTTAVTIDDVGSMGSRPIGGHDIDGDGVDEAFISITGPASGVIVGVFRTDDCQLWPVTDSESGLAFSFPVTASIGTFSGATCNGMGDLDLYSGELVDADTGEYMVAQAPYTYSDGEMTAEFGDAGSVQFDDIHEYSSLDCGDLGSGL